MTQKDKDLLLKDLCARLPFKVKVKVECTTANGKKIEDEGVLNSIFINEFNTIYVCVDEIEYELEHIKPYLRSLSSMTEEEEKEYSSLWDLQDEYSTDLDIQYKIDLFDWLNKNNFDFRGLIPSGHAIEVTEDNNPYKD